MQAIETAAISEYTQNYKTVFPKMWSMSRYQFLREKSYFLGNIQMLIVFLLWRVANILAFK